MFQTEVKKELIFLYCLPVVSGHTVEGGSIWTFSLESNLSNISNVANKISKFMPCSCGSACNETPKLSKAC